MLPQTSQKNGHQLLLFVFLKSRNLKSIPIIDPLMKSREIASTEPRSSRIPSHSPGQAGAAELHMHEVV